LKTTTANWLSLSLPLMGRISGFKKIPTQAQRLRVKGPFG
jgi:hypothetical protein